MDHDEIWSRMATMRGILPAMIDPTFLTPNLAPAHNVIQSTDKEESNKLGISIPRGSSVIEVSPS